MRAGVLLGVGAAWGTGCTGWKPGLYQPVDCSGLPAAPPDLLERIAAGRNALTDAPLLSGQSQVVICIVDEHGDNTYVTEPEDGGRWMVHEPYDAAPFLGSRLPLPCTPEAAVTPQFITSLSLPQRGRWADVVVEPGTYPIRHIGIDVPAREQGATDDWFDGDFTVTDVTDCRISGYLAGRGGGTLMSYLTQDSYDFEFVVEGASFRDLDVYYCVEE